MYKYKLAAVIPTVQYGNLQPEIELEGDDIEALKADAEKHIQSIWDKFGERPLVSKTGDGVKLKTFTDEFVIYNDHLHKYFDENGNALLSGSAYAATKVPQFNKEMLLPKTAKAWDVDSVELGELWDMNGRLSTEYGSAIHTALEVYHRYHKMGSKIQSLKDMDDNYALPKIHYLRDIVLSFVEQFGDEAESEVLISDVANKRAGRIDRLQILDIDKKVCRIGDYKTNFELKKDSLTQYQHQLSFYADILKQKGWTVEGLDLYHYSDGWNKIELEVLPIE